MSEMSLEEANEEAVRRIRAAKECGQWWLDLGDLPITRVPDEIALLADQLTALGLGSMPVLNDEGEFLFSRFEDHSGSLADIDVLSSLTILTTLSLQECWKLKSLEPLRGLIALESLDLEGCSLLETLEPLQNLDSLISLKMGGCSRLRSLEPIRGFTALASLNVWGCSKLKSLEPVQDLTSLASLNLMGCSVDSLEPLRNLTTLVSLNLRGCWRLKSLEPLLGLPVLASPDVAFCSQLEKLEPLQGLTTLASLELTNCWRLEDLEPLRGLTGLVSLNLSGCNLNTFSPILERLPTLETLSVFDNRFHDLHPSVCGSFGSDNAIDSVRAYYAALGPDARPDAEIKVFVLGNGRAGKTKLVGRLKGRSFGDIPEGSTHGVRVESWAVPESWELPHPVTLNLWDFGGQDIYHGTHALFVREPAIYLLLYSNATENEDQIPDGGFVHRNRLLPYWFDYLRQEAGNRGVVSSPVLFIQSQCDTAASEHKQPPFVPEEGFPNLAPPIHVSSVGRGRGLNNFREKLREAIESLLCEHPQPPLPATWTAVRDDIRAMQQARSPRTLSLTELRALCRNRGCSGDGGVLRDALHLMGAVFYRKGTFDDRIIVDRTWVLDAIYTLFTRDHARQRRIDGQKGRFTRDDLELYFWEGYSVADQRTFLSFMEQCGICFRTATGGGEEYEGEYIIPDKLERWGPNHDKEYCRHLRDDSGVEVTATFGLLHDGIARAFLSKIGSVAGDRATWWRFGCHFHDGRTGSEALIRTDRNVVRMQAWEGRAMELLRTLVQVLQSIPYGQPPRIDWLSRIEEAVREPRAEPTDPKPEKQLDPKYPPQTVFVSYSHEPASRDFVERHLVPKLEAAGWRVVWDVKDLKHGSSISEFCDRVREIPYLVPVIAGDYLKKRWCLSELLGFFETNRCDEAELRSHAVVATEPDHIDDPIQRSEHAFESERLFDELLDRGGRYLDLATIGQCRKLVGWSIQLADILRVLADHLGERGLDEVTAEKVVEMLTQCFHANPRR